MPTIKYQKADVPYKRDIPHAVVRFIDAGHFALETRAAEIADAIRGCIR